MTTHKSSSAWRRMPPYVITQSENRVSSNSNWTLSTACRLDKYVMVDHVFAGSDGWIGFYPTRPFTKSPNDVLFTILLFTFTECLLATPFQPSNLPVLTNRAGCQSNDFTPALGGFILTWSVFTLWADEQCVNQWSVAVRRTSSVVLFTVWRLPQVSWHNTAYRIETPKARINIQDILILLFHINFYLATHATPPKPQDGKFRYQRCPCHIQAFHLAHVVLIPVFFI
jgi:hypothetical protein